MPQRANLTITPEKFENGSRTPINYDQVSFYIFDSNKVIRLMITTSTGATVELTNVKVISLDDFEIRGKAYREVRDPLTNKIKKIQVSFRGNWQ